MAALKTIVATAVIVFVLSTVAMAGVQHYAGQGETIGGTQAQAIQPTYTITMTAAQLKALIESQGDDAAKAETNGQRDRRQDKVRDRAQVRDRDSARTTTRDHAADHNATRPVSASGGANSGTGTCAPNAYDHDYDWGGSGDGQHHSGDGDHHSGAEDEDCR